MSKEWDPDEALNSLATESDVHDGETYAETSERLLRENAPRAVLALVHLSQHSANEAIRMKAAMYVTDRVLGRIADSNPLGHKDPFAEMGKILTSPIKSAETN